MQSITAAWRERWPSSTVTNQNQQPIVVVVSPARWFQCQRLASYARSADILTSSNAVHAQAASSRSQGHTFRSETSLASSVHTLSCYSLPWPHHHLLAATFELVYKSQLNLPALILTPQKAATHRCTYARRLVKSPSRSVPLREAADDFRGRPMMVALRLCAGGHRICCR